MASVLITRELFLDDRQGRTFADVTSDASQVFDVVLAFFNDTDRQRRMEESELHHNRPPLAGVVRELEADATIDRFLANESPGRSKRLRQAVGVVVRMIMERRGWQKTGKKGSLGVRNPGANRKSKHAARHNTGGLAFWFLRAERYEHADGMPYRTVRARRNELKMVPLRKPTAD